MATVRIRPLRQEDAAQLAPLCEQLGYPATPEQVERRLALALRTSRHGLLGAVADDESLLGWIHVDASELLVWDPYAEICSLVVDARVRSQGIGRALVAAAESWALAQGFTIVRVRSNVIRLAAHRFYEQLGYERVKTQHTFAKSLSPVNTGEAAPT
jgi:GNAT superfamily N-acetyltransferase